jgi:hypothetical protein
LMISTCSRGNGTNAKQKTESRDACVNREQVGSKVLSHART